MKLIADGLAVNYQVTGKGKLILFLHGWGSNLTTFDRLTQTLEKSFQCVNLDLPGFGASEEPKKPWDLDAYINFLNEFLAKAKLPKLYAIVAHSLGGRVAIKAVGGGRLEVSKLVLLGAHGIRESKSLRSKMFWIAAKVGKLATSPLPTRYRTNLRRRLYQKAGSTDYLDAGTMRVTFLNIIGEDVRPEAAMINVPTLLVYGQEDTTTPPHIGKIFHGLIEGSKFETIAEAGHFVHTDETEAVSRLVADFLK